MLRWIWRISHPTENQMQYSSGFTDISVLIGRTRALCYNGCILTPSNNVLSEKLLVAQLNEKLDAFRSTRIFIAMCTRAF
jgi:hypothetical protein